MNVALLGLGVVGRGVYDIIKRDFDDIKVKYILEKDDEKVRDLEYLRVSSLDHIINDENIDVVIELIGGKSVAYEFVKEALKHKKHVVTANKALMSEYFEELTLLAKKQDVSLLYEASVGGAIIILDELKKIAKINNINKIEGIVNGATNYVLSRVFCDGISLDEGVAEAFDKGYLETGSTDDMDGLDALRKINILSMIAYDTYLLEDDFDIVSLSSVSSEMIEYIKSKNLVLKYIAFSLRDNDIVNGYVCPTVMGKDSIISKINYEENIISVYGEYHKKQSFIGQGAGRYPTASAVVYDLLTIKNHQKITSEHKNTYLTNRNHQKHCFLVQNNHVIYKTKQMTFQELLEDKSVVCFVKVEGDVYEKL